MPKKLAVFGATLAFVAVAVPTLASASSLTSLQVSAIVSLLQSFGANSSTIASVQAALTGQPSTTASPSCVSLTSDLYAGETDAQTNGQVSQLQSFLNVNPTGYFGPLTEQAVQNYQSSHGIVSSGSPDTTGYGFVGPITRQSIGCTAQTPAPVNNQSPVSSSLQTYTNSQYGFSFQYPNTMTVSSTYSGFETLGDNYVPVVHVTTGTLSSGDSGVFGVSVSTNTADVTNCLNTSQGGYDAKTLSMNGTSYLSYTVGSQATQSAESDQVYQTLDGNACLVLFSQLNTKDHSSSAGTSQAQADIAQINSEINPIFNSFKFTGAIPNTPTATIDQSSLTTRWSNIPTLSGSASGLSSVYVTMSGNNQEGHSQGNVPVINGRWSTSIYPLAISAFPSGTYQVSVYAPTSYPVDPTSAAPLTTGTVTMVDVPSAGPISTSSSSPWAPVFTGTAMNTSTVNLLILNASSTPQYATVLSSGTIPVTNGNWAWHVLPGAISSGSYVVQVLAGGTNTFIAADPFTVSANGTVILGGWTGQKG